ncbi:growth arrest-specific protein 8 [Trichogramma pretiosum]|uniref:growth arrest-specific protein 8 n=1 Tax=Trichogramma pretiosum TaxID=7493 RepID=UPI000C719919|nr:growth arrest-specific protein 8 [Trichogramma pretiosum]
MPKAGKGSGGAGKNSAGVDIAKMTKEQLEVYSAKLLEELEREREERNYFQLERDNIQTFWDITRQQLQESKSLNRVLKKEAHDFTKKFEDEALQSRKKFTHLVHTYQTEAATINVEHLVALKKFQNRFVQKKTEIINNNNNAMKIQNEANLDNLVQTQALKLQHRKVLEEAKEEFKRNTLDMQDKYDEKIAAYRKNFSLRHNVEIAEVEERKNEHVDRLLKEHEAAFQELKAFYNNVLLNNLSVIEGLKKKFSQVKKNEVKMMGQIKDKVDA